MRIVKSSTFSQFLVKFYGRLNLEAESSDLLKVAS